MNLLDK